MVNLVLFTDVAAYTLTIDKSPTVGGSIVVDPLDSFDLIYPENTLVTLTAIAATDYNFISWSGDVSDTDSTIIVTMNSNKNITANFTETTSENVTWKCPIGGVTLIAPHPSVGRPLLTAPLDPSEITISNGAELWGIYYLDEVALEWLYYIPGLASSTLTKLEPEQFYLVVVSDDCELLLPSK
jgi:hypothetical protein